MSERKDNNWLLSLVLVLTILTGFCSSARQEGKIADLERRVGQLESERR